MGNVIKAYLGCIGGLLIFNLILGGLSVDYVLRMWFAKDIPFIGDTLIGLVLAELTIPAAIVTWLLHFFGAI